MHATMKHDLLSHSEVRRENDRLGAEFEPTHSLIDARRPAGLRQAEFAKLMNTAQSAVAHLESGNRTPAQNTLRRYAEASGSRLHVSLNT